MKRLLLLCVLFAFGSVATPRLLAVAPDPGDRFLEAYFYVMDGDAAEAKSDWTKASAKYNTALEILRELKTQQADWNPLIVDFRTKYCLDHLNALKSKLPGPPVTPPAPVPVVSTPAPTTEAAPVAPPPPAPAPEADRLTQLNADLQRAQDQIRQLQQDRDAIKAKLDAELQKPAATDRDGAQQALVQLRALQTTQDVLNAKLAQAEAKAAQAEALKTELQQTQAHVTQLEADRDQLNTKLQQALAGTNTVTQTTPQIEELLKKNAALAAEIAGLKERLATNDTATAAATAADQVKLRTELLSARSELDTVKQQLLGANAELTAVKTELQKVKEENVELKRSREEVIAKLVITERQLRAAKGSTEKDNQIISQLRQENDVLKRIAHGKANPAVASTTTAKHPWFWPWGKAPDSAKHAGPPTAMKESGTEKLVASINAPKPVATQDTAPAPVTTNTPAIPPTGTPMAGGVRDLLNEARAAVALKDYDTAANKYDTVLAKDPQNVTALSQLAVIRYRQKRLDEAEDSLRKAVALAPNDAASRALLGVVCVRKGKVEEAYGELTRAVALDPRNAEAHNYLGVVLNEKGWTSSAEQEIRRALELNSQYAEAHFNLAVIYSRRKTPRWDLAKFHYQKATDLGAEHDTALEALLKEHDTEKK